MGSSPSRRDFIKKSGQAIFAIPVLGMTNSGLGNASTSFPSSQNTGSSSQEFNVRDFGALGDGQTKDTLAIQQAIDRCWVMGGGTVYIPPGNYLTGAIALRSHVLLKLEEKAILSGTPDFNDYPILQVRWEGKWIKGHAALIYAIDAEHTGIIGKGHIAGNHALGGRPNDKYPLRHPALIEPIGCKHLRFEDFSTDYHLMWCCHPTYCEDVVFRNLNIRSTGGNGDGIDIDSCKKVLIEGCDIATGDDCIAIKSGRGMEGYKLLQTTEDITIRNCTLADSIFACIGIGSETSGGIRGVHIEGCRFIQARTHAIYIKSRPGRGAFIENISASNLEVSGMQGGFLRFNILGSGLQDPEPVPGHEGIPTVKNFSFRNIKVDDVPVLVDGTAVHPDKPLDGLVLENISGTCRKGISLANIKNARIKNITVTGFQGPLLGIHEVSGSGLKNAVTIEGPKVPDPILPKNG